MERKKIVFLDEGQGIGGAQINLFNILKYLDRHRFYPIVIVAYKGKVYEEISKLNVEAVLLNTPSFSSTSIEIGDLRILNIIASIYNLFLIILKSARLLSWIRKENIFLIHTNGLFEHIYGGITARISDIPCIWHMQDIPSFFGLGKFIFNILVTLLPYRIIVVSNAVKEVFYSNMHKRITLIYNSIGKNRFISLSDKNKYRLKKRLNIKDDEFIIGMISRLTPWKGHRVFLKAAATIIKRIPNVKFVIAGDVIFGRRSYKKELEIFASNLGIKEKVYFLGFIENIQEVLSILDIFVSCSVRPESFSLSIIEAMACGKPVIATSLGGSVEIIENGRDGILVPPDDYLALSNKIIQLLDSFQKRTRLGRNAQKKAKKMFSMERYINELEVLYHSIS